MQVTRREARKCPAADTEPAHLLLLSHDFRSIQVAFDLILALPISSMSGPGAGFEYPAQDVSWLKRYTLYRSSRAEAHAANEQQETSYYLQIALAAPRTSFIFSMFVTPSLWSMGHP